MKSTVRCKRLALRAAAIIILAGTASCAGNILPGAFTDPAPIYVLSPKSTFPDDLPKVDWQLTIDVPVADAGLNSRRIAVRQSQYSMDYFARANWIDSAPIMVQTLLVESFENTAKIISVGRQSVTLRPDYSLLTELREFQAEYFGPGAPRVRVRLNAKLVKMPQRVIIATSNFEAVESSAKRDLPSVVRSFDEALGKVLKRLVTWTLRNAPKRAHRTQLTR